MTAPIFGSDTLCLCAAPVHLRGTNHCGYTRARLTDPETSHEAAASVSDKLRESQEVVLSILRYYGPMTDDAMVVYAINHPMPRRSMSASGARTRRAELVQMGKVRDSGRREVLASGRRAVVWEAVA